MARIPSPAPACQLAPAPSPGRLRPFLPREPPRPAVTEGAPRPPPAGSRRAVLPKSTPPVNWHHRSVEPGQARRGSPAARITKSHTSVNWHQQGYLTAYTTRLVTSVVCRGFIPARGDIAIRQPAPEGFSPGAVASLLRYRARRPIRIQLRRAGATSPRSGTDSDLEAFSHYPADGSVAALPGQTAAKTNYLNQRFLSY
ncbi:predicted protein [Aspergillus nidulans FGSC A4]|uniref:Uncharacterized protein n=1 Tax=Emericella nidulans (strain FGSC A4 / ATCC 38163 / CBS 112.46 / NRRL 194 / M139) TaxID=227321 RepID=Q5B2I5_EMENI|nr:predicted protein [Aspergillus nidulans FGSC A4]CBF81163.1 TPA: hypothetical protein ANIA_05245 [Aspergillus nidulans FGSC A4]|eukprot:XP_662849.1 predicted protein [Aspergillus nidulans FGSC A4]